MNDYDKMKEILSKLKRGYIVYEEMENGKAITIFFVYGYGVTFLFDEDGMILAEVNNIG